MTSNVIDMKHMDDLMDSIDLIFSRVLAQVTTEEDVELVRDMLVNNAGNFTDTKIKLERNRNA